MLCMLYLLLKLPFLVPVLKLPFLVPVSQEILSLGNIVAVTIFPMEMCHFN